MAKTIAQQLNVTDFPFEIIDNQGNEIYFEDSCGYWSKSEYDAEGREISHINSRGFWGKKEYDSENREIFHKDSSGFWWKCEFDSEGNRIYYEDSSGLIRDNRPKDDVITLNGVKYKRIDE